MICGGGSPMGDEGPAPGIAARDLLALTADDPAFEALSDRLDVYCPFEALGVARQEIRHSNFLADILSPGGPHGFGDVFARAFLDFVLQRNGALDTRLDVHLADVNRLEVRREWRNIDLLLSLALEDRMLVVAVEVKLERRARGSARNL